MVLDVDQRDNIPGGLVWVVDPAFAVSATLRRLHRPASVENGGHGRHGLTPCTAEHLIRTCAGGFPPHICISFVQSLFGASRGINETATAHTQATAKNISMARARYFRYARDVVTAIVALGLLTLYWRLTLATFAPPGWPGQCVSVHPGMEWHAPPAGQPGPRSHFPDGLQQLQSFMQTTPLARCAWQIQPSRLRGSTFSKR